MRSLYGSDSRFACGSHKCGSTVGSKFTAVQAPLYMQLEAVQYEWSTTHSTQTTKTQKMHTVMQSNRAGTKSGMLHGRKGGEGPITEK